MDQLLYGASCKYTHGMGDRGSEHILIANNNQKLTHFLLGASASINDVVIWMELLSHKEL